MIKLSYLLFYSLFLLFFVPMQADFNLRRRFLRLVLSTDQRAKINAKKEKVIREHWAEEFTFHTTDGLTLRGLFIKRDHAKYTLLACHGYHLGKESMAYCIDMFPDAHILLLDFRAHGESEGNFITCGFAEPNDIKAAVDWLRANKVTATLPLIGLGFSMGGASLLGALSQGVFFDAVILDSCFADLRIQFDRHLSRTNRFLRMFTPIIYRCFYWFTGIDIAAVSPVKWIQNIQTPLFIIHSRDDEVAFEQDAHQLYQAAPNAQLWLVGGSMHGGIRKDYAGQYQKKVTSFIQQHISINK